MSKWYSDVLGRICYHAFNSKQNYEEFTFSKPNKLNCIINLRRNFQITMCTNIPQLLYIQNFGISKGEVVNMYATIKFHHIGLQMKRLHSVPS